MVAPAAPAALHLLTPGSPAYALLKVGAIGGVFALRMAMGRRARADEHAAPPEPPAPAPRRNPHPVSKKKRRRRR